MCVERGLPTHSLTHSLTLFLSSSLVSVLNTLREQQKTLDRMYPSKDKRRCEMLKANPPAIRTMGSFMSLALSQVKCSPWSFGLRLDVFELLAVRLHVNYLYHQLPFRATYSKTHEPHLSSKKSPPYKNWNPRRGKTLNCHLSSVFWWLNLVKQYSLYKILYPKGGYNLTLYWVP